MATPETIARVVELIRDAWADRPFKLETQLRLYQRVLADLPDEAVMAATAQRLADSNPYLPRPGEIRQAAIDLLTGSDDVMPAEEAWGRLMQRIRRYGSNPVFWEGLTPLPRLVAMSVQAIGGLRALGMSEMLAADRARFLEAYQTFVDRERKRVGQLPEVRQTKELFAAERQKLLGGGDNDKGT